MLGRLARWLRMIGCDVEYYPVIGDGELVARAEKTGRMILTRDTLLVKRRWARDHHFMVVGDHYRDQLRQVMTAFAIDPMDSFLSRCLECNEQLQEIDREKVADMVPPYVLATQKVFRICPGCRRVYWAGTHRQRMAEEIQDLHGRSC